MAPSNQPIMAWGPPIAATKAEIVMNGPMPTIIDMFRLTAWSKCIRRGSIGHVLELLPRSVRKNATS